MTEFLVFILPVLQLNKWRSAARKMLNTTRASNESKKVSEYANLPISQCAICHDNNKRAAAAGQKVFEASGSITNPYVTNCGHIYCYVCLASRFNYMDVSGNSMNCLRCFEKLRFFQEYGVFEEGDEVNDIVDKDAITIYQEDDDEDDDDGDEEDEDNNNGENNNGENGNMIDIVSSIQDSGNSEYDEDDEEEDDEEDDDEEYFEEDDYDDGQFEDEYDDFEEAMDL
jgi:peroxin-2